MSDQNTRYCVIYFKICTKCCELQKNGEKNEKKFKKVLTKYLPWGKIMHEPVKVFEFKGKAIARL